MREWEAPTNNNVLAPDFLKINKGARFLCNRWPVDYKKLIRFFQVKRADTIIDRIW